MGISNSDKGTQEVTGERPSQSSGSAGAKGVRAPSSLLGVLKGTSSSSRLNEEGKVYVENLRKELDRLQCTVQTLPLGDDRFDGVLLVSADKRFGLPIIYHDTYVPGTDMAPPVEYIDVLKQRFAHHAGDSNAVLLETLNISDDDFKKVDAMAAFVDNIFKGIASDISVDLVSNERFVCTTDMGRVRTFVDRISPHAVPARAEIGFLVSLLEPQQKATFGLNSDDRPDWLEKEFFAVTGYTTFINCASTGFSGTRGNQKQFMPVVHISDIVSAVPVRDVVPIAIALATYLFIHRNGWIKQFTNFITAAPNIGNLMMNPDTNAPHFVDNDTALYEMLDEYIDDPCLALEITDGRARCQGIDNYAEDPGSIITSLRKFFHLPADSDDPVIFNEGWSSYTGTCIVDGKNVDTRCIDYLHMMALGSDPADIKEYNYEPVKPEDHIRLVREYYADKLKVMYTTTTVVLQPDLCDTLVELLRPAMQITFEASPEPNRNGGARLRDGGANKFRRDVGFADRSIGSFRRRNARFGNL